MASLSQGIVLTTAMLVSSTVLYLVFSKQKIAPSFQIHGNPDSQDSSRQILRSCLYSEEKRRERKTTKKKVQFAEGVKEASKGKQRKRNRGGSNCREETPGIRRMPANRIALYHGILRDRVHRMECSY